MKNIVPLTKIIYVLLISLSTISAQALEDNIRICTFAGLNNESFALDMPAGEALREKLESPQNFGENGLVKTEIEIVYLDSGLFTNNPNAEYISASSLHSLHCEILFLNFSSIGIINSVQSYYEFGNEVISWVEIYGGLLITDKFFFTGSSESVFPLYIWGDEQYDTVAIEYIPYEGQEHHPIYDGPFGVINRFLGTFDPAGAAGFHYFTEPFVSGFTPLADTETPAIRITLGEQSRRGRGGVIATTLRNEILFSSELSDDPHTYNNGDIFSLNFFARAVSLYNQNNMPEPIITSPTNGLVTNQTLWTIEGWALPGSLVEIGTDNPSIYCADDGLVADLMTGLFSCQLNAELDEGTRIIDVRSLVTDESSAYYGAEKTTSALMHVDLTPPSTPDVIYPEFGGVTNDETPGISGAGEPGSIVNVVGPGGVACQATVNVDGSWYCQITNALPDGFYVFDVFAEDAVGNQSGLIQHEFTIDSGLQFDFDLSVSLVNCQNGVRPLDAVRYLISVRNVGAENVTGASLETDLSEFLNLDSTIWSCFAEGGASCTSPHGFGNINELVNLDANEALLYLIDTSVLENTLTETVSTYVTVPVATDGFIDANPSDNTASDFDLVYQYIHKDGFDCSPTGVK